jgi:hypothetical protein
MTSARALAFANALVATPPRVGDVVVGLTEREIVWAIERVRTLQRRNAEHAQRGKQTFTATFEAKPGCEGVRALRAILKLAWRRYHMRCLEAREEIHDA